MVIRTSIGCIRFRAPIGRWWTGWFRRQGRRGDAVGLVAALHAGVAVAPGSRQEGPDHRADDLLQGYLLSKVLEKELLSGRTGRRALPHVFLTTLDRYTIDEVPGRGPPSARPIKRRCWLTRSIPRPPTPHSLKHSI